MIMVEFLQCYFGLSLHSYFDPPNFLQELLVFTPLIQCGMTLFTIWSFSIKFTTDTFCHCKIKMQHRNDFWNCIEPGLAKFNQQTLHSFKEQRCISYLDDILPMALLMC